MSMDDFPPTTPETRMPRISLIDERCDRHEAQAPVEPAAPEPRYPSAAAILGDDYDKDDDPPPLPDNFLPAPRRLRADGWTPAKQRAFIEALADTGSITEACRTVGKSRQSVYALRRSASNSMFLHAWDVAIRIGIERLRDLALERATQGVANPVWYKGELIGERRVFNDRLLMYLMNRAPDLDRSSLTMDQIRQIWPAMLDMIDAVGPQPYDREDLAEIFSKRGDGSDGWQLN